MPTGIPDDTARENAHSSVRRLRGASVKDSGTSAETREFSNLMCGSERVTIIDVDKPRVSLVGADCEKFCRRWTIGNFVSDNGVFVVKDENHKTQRTLLFVHEKCDECEGHLMYLTQKSR